MNMFQAVILSVIQGFTEFLPVSSSGHLMLGAELLKLPSPGLSFSIWVHVGTALATVVVLRKEIFWIVAGLFKPKMPAQRSRVLQVLSYVIIASVPSAFVALLAEDLVERLFSSAFVAAVGLLFTGTFLSLARAREKLPCVSGDRASGKNGTVAFRKTSEARPGYPTYRSNKVGGVVSRRANTFCSKMKVENDQEFSSLKFGRILAVGLSQALAIVPGVSRSGITITTGLLAGMSREDAARFSFLLSLPAVFGAGLLDIRSMLSTGQALVSRQAFLGAAISFVAGLLALTVVFRMVRRGELSRFSYYCWTVGLVSLIRLFL